MNEWMQMLVYCICVCGLLEIHRVKEKKYSQRKGKKGDKKLCVSHMKPNLSLNVQAHQIFSYGDEQEHHHYHHQPYACWVESSSCPVPV